MHPSSKTPIVDDAEEPEDSQDQVRDSDQESFPEVARVNEPYQSFDLLELQDRNPKYLDRFLVTRVYDPYLTVGLDGMWILRP
jgi:hypothetical protein